MGGGTKGEDERIFNKLVFTAMEGCSRDSVMPPLSQPPPSSSHEPGAIAETGNAYGKRGRQMGTKLLERSESLQMERGRRLKMSHLFAELQSTVPGLLSKATREVIVNQTIHYIKDLEKKKKRLEELKDSSMESVAGRLMLPCTSRNTSITVTVSGNVAFFGIQSAAQAGLITVIFNVFYKHDAEILAANVSVNHGQLTLAITALVENGDGNSTAEKIKTEILSL